jgi:hypothetical protein
MRFKICLNENLDGRASTSTKSQLELVLREVLG